MVGFLKRHSELILQCLRPSEPVRLEHHDDSLVWPRAGGGDRGSDFRGMVTVVIHDDLAGAAVKNFEPTPSPSEGFHCGGNFIESHTNFCGEGDGG